MSLFVHVETRRRRQWQWATLLIVSLCVLCFLWLALMPIQQRLAVLLEWGTVPANIFDAREPLWPQLTDPSLLRLFTALFIHVTWLHGQGVLQAGAALYHAAIQRHPHRWSGALCNWTPMAAWLRRQLP